MLSSIRRIPTVAVLTLAAATLLAPRADAGDWKGAEETVDGVVHVKNTAEPIDPEMTIELDEVYRLGGWDGGDDEFFGVIAAMLQDEDENVYLLDAQLNEIKIYDADGVYLNSIGREGEGPGEFRNANAMFWLPNGQIGINQVFPGRIVTLTRDGMPGDDFRLAETDTGENRIFFAGMNAGDNLAIVYGGFSFDQATMEWSQTRTLGVFDGEGGEIAAVHTADLAMDMKAPVISENMFDGFWNRLTAAPDGRVATVNELHEYAITVYAPDGSTDRVIERAYPEHKRTDEEVAEVREIYEGFTRNQIPNPNKTYDISDVHPPVQFRGIAFRPDGSMWVSTSRGTNDMPDDTLGTFDVYDPKGRFVRQVKLQGQFDNDNDAVFFVGDRIYVITEFVSSAMSAQGGGAEGEDEEEAEPMAVICYRSDDLDRAASIPNRPADSR